MYTRAASGSGKLVRSDVVQNARRSIQTYVIEHMVFTHNVKTVHCEPVEECLIPQVNFEPGGFKHNMRGLYTYPSISGLNCITGKNLMCSHTHRVNLYWGPDGFASIKVSCAYT